MAQKLTLTEYLRRRGAIKALTRIEAKAFGIPWPLQSGWPAKFAGMEITSEMLADLKVRIASAKQSTVRKARCALDGVADEVGASPPLAFEPGRATVVPHSPVYGFVLRPARRYRSRKSAPWS